MTEIEDQIDSEVASLVVSLLDKVRRLKFQRAMREQAEVAKQLRNGSSAIYDDKGNLRGEMKIAIDPFLENQLRIQRHAENKYMREHQLSPFADPEYIPYLKKVNPIFDLKFRPKEGKVFMPSSQVQNENKTI
ncbi:MAG: hypothetical protein J6K91_05865 [Opitutales bacterium]|nr:hypothetical protein [Opitutales bacterium]